MPQIADPELICPLIAGQPTPDRSFHVQNIFGTAFSIGGQTLFLSAGHSISTAQEEGTVVLGFPHSGGFAMCQVDEVEVFPNYDVGIVRVKKRIQHMRGIRWCADTSTGRDDVIAIGFPHAFDPSEGSITSRGFKGHIVGSYRYSRLAANPLCHELSFQAPRGLSGAPLLLLRQDEPIVAGVVVCNRAIEMEVYRDVEILDDGKTRDTFIRFEALQLGLAVDGAALLEVTSRILGSTLREHLQRHNLLWRPDR
jgi:hypothetical protein